MTLSKAVVLAFVATLAAIMLAVFGWPTHVNAAPSKCKYDLVPTMMALGQKQVALHLLPEREREQFVHLVETQIGFRFPRVTNVLIVAYGGFLQYGIESGGCLSGPVIFARLPSEKRSGLTPMGVFA